MGKTQNITLQLSQELFQKVQDLAGKKDINDFLIAAINGEIQRRQSSNEKIDFWQELEQLKNKMKQEGIDIDPQEIWGDIRDQEVGREITL